MQTVGFWNANGNLVTKNVNNYLVNPFNIITSNLNVEQCAWSI